MSFLTMKFRVGMWSDLAQHRNWWQFPLPNKYDGGIWNLLSFTDFSGDSTPGPGRLSLHARILGMVYERRFFAKNGLEPVVDGDFFLLSTRPPQEFLGAGWLAFSEELMLLKRHQAIISLKKQQFKGFFRRAFKRWQGFSYKKHSKY